jgi:hypothetical protein
MSRTRLVSSPPRLLEVHLPQSADRIGIENGIDADEWHRFHDRLRDDHSIEWLAVIVAGRVREFSPDSLRIQGKSML